MNIKSLLNKLKLKRIIGVEFIQEGKLFARYYGEKYHIDDHNGDCKPEMRCTIKPIKKIKIRNNNIKIIYDDNSIVYRQVRILTITRRRL